MLLSAFLPNATRVAINQARATWPLLRRSPLTSPILAQLQPANDTVAPLPSAETRPTPTASTGDFHVTVGEASFGVHRGQSIYESAEAAGVELSASCQMGGCGACKMRLVSGDVDTEEPNCLTDDERDDGVILTCVSRPRTDITLTDI